MNTIGGGKIATKNLDLLADTTFAKGAVSMTDTLDYSVTWNEVKNIVDKLIKNHDEKIPMSNVERAVRNAWIIIYNDRDKQFFCQHDFRIISPITHAGPYQYRCKKCGKSIMCDDLHYGTKQIKEQEDRNDIRI